MKTCSSILTKQLTKWLLVLLFGISWLSPAFAQSNEPLAPEVAFALSGRLLDEDGQKSTLEVRFKIVDGYYLYLSKVRTEITPVINGLSMVAMNHPKGESHNDEFFGTTEIYRNIVVLPYDILGAIPAAGLTISVFSQGCSESIGVCYPPQEQMLTLAANGEWLSFKSAEDTETMGILGMFAPVAANTSLVTDNVNASVKESVNLSNETTNDDLSDSDKIAEQIGNRGLILSLLIFFGLGLALSLTPCNLPMVPILAALITGSLKQKQAETNAKTPSSNLRGLVLAAGFVLGMSITYAIVGSIAGLTGNLLSSQLQLPSVQIFTALLMLALAAGCFGWYTLQLPASVQTWLRGRADKPTQGSFGGLVFSGALSALIVGPCVAAPLAGLIIYIGQQGSAWVGASLLFALAWGQGIPLLAFGFFADRFMPKLGTWMEAINQLFGFALIALAIWFVGPLLSVSSQLIAYSAWLILCAVFLNALEPLEKGAHGLRFIGKSLGVLMLVIGVAMIIGMLSGSKSVWPPLSHFAQTSFSGTTQQVSAPKWTTLKTVAEVQNAIGKANDKPVLLDFYADWCVSCKEMEHLTFADAKVANAMNNFLLLRVDVTANDNEDAALLKHFGLFGPPALLFFNNGIEKRSLRLVGFEDAMAFHSRLTRLK